MGRRIAITLAALLVYRVGRTARHRAIFSLGALCLTVGVRGLL